MIRTKLRNLIEEYSRRNKECACNAVYSVTNSQGFVPSSDYFSKEVYSKDLSTYKIVRRGMIAYNPSRVNVGSIAVQSAEDEVIVSPLYVVFKVKEDVLLPEFLTYFLRSEIGLREIAAHTSGSVRDSLKFSALQDIEINLCSIEQQKEIVVKLKKIEQLLSQRQLSLHKIDDLVKSQFIEMFGDLENNNKRLPIKPLSALCTVSSSKRIYQSELTQTGVPFLRVSDLVNKIENGEAIPSLYIGVEKYDELLQRSLVPQKGDILVTSRGTLGKCYIIDENDRFYFQDGMISWLSEIDPQITPLFLSYLFGMDVVQKQIRQMQAGSTVAYLSISMLKQIRVPVPKKKDLLDFSAFIEQTDKSKFRIKQSLEKLEICYKALLQKYFG